MAPPANSVLSTKCCEDGCTRSIHPRLLALATRCQVHQMLHDARWLSRKDLAELRTAIYEVVPATKDERRQRKVTGALQVVRDYARSSARAEQTARERGASHLEIAAALHEGARAFGQDL